MIKLKWQEVIRKRIFLINALLPYLVYRPLVLVRMDEGDQLDSLMKSFYPVSV